MVTEPGLRARKKLERRQRIESAALALFARDGFDATTVEAIAAAADVSPRTFFHHFPTKEDVALADYAERLRRITQVLAEQPPDEPAWSALRSSFLVVAADYEAEREALRLRFGLMATTPSLTARSLQLQAGWEEALAGVLASRTDPTADGSEPHLLAAAALAVMRSALRLWLADGGGRPLPERVAEGFDHLGRGLDGSPVAGGRRRRGDVTTRQKRA